MVESKENIRKQFLQKRDGLSADFIGISSKQIRKNLNKIEEYRNAQSVACYYSIGSEVKTHEIMQEILSHGKTLGLPRIEGNEIIFCNVKKFEDLEKGEFGIMEPKQNCPILEKFDIIIVPAVAMAENGQRLGYGIGYYDRFLAGKNTLTIALAYTKSIAKNIPRSDSDVLIDMIVTEDGVIESKIG